MPLRLPGIRILNYINDWLILAVALVGCSASRCHSCPHEIIGVTGKCNLNGVLSPLQRTNF